MSRGVVEQIAAIHRVDPEQAALGFLGDGRHFLDRQLAHWAGEMRRVQRGPLPALERLLTELIAQQPEQCRTVTLVHGDPKPGNFAFVDDEVSAVFDWELTTLGDPLADIGWAEVNWTTPGSFTIRPGGLSTDEFVELYEELSGIPGRAPRVVPRLPGIQDGRHHAHRRDAVRPRGQRRPALRLHGHGRRHVHEAGAGVARRRRGHRARTVSDATSRVRRGASSANPAAARYRPPTSTQMPIRQGERRLGSRLSG